MKGNKLKVINLFGGPGISKSTTRAGLFYKMKSNMMNVEEVTEYAKDVTWEGNGSILADQLFVLANQNRKLERLKNKVEWVISDSPILLSIHYATPEYLPNTFRNLVFDLWDTYENFNFLLKRNKPYVQIGRNQTEAEAKEIDVRIEEMLKEKHIPYIEIRGGENAVDEIYNRVRQV